MKKNLLFYALAVVCLVTVLLIPFDRQKAVQTASWGLHFSGEGQPPQGTDGAEQLRQLDAAYIGNTSQKVLYLTFDAGYENNKDLVRRMVEEGHIVGNHTMHHPDMQKKDGEAFAKELKDLEDLFREITGKELPKYYRPPQGLYSQKNLEMAQSLGYKTVFWSLAYADWDNNKQPTREYAFSKLLPRIHNGAVLLLHSTSKTNADILDELLTRYRQMGYTFASLESLFS